MKPFEINKVYCDFIYPSNYLNLLELNLIDYEEWFFLNPTQVAIRIEGLQQRYPHRKLIPFARREDNDDIACFEVGKKDSVQIIHDFASEGYEQKKQYDKFIDWYNDIKKE